MQSTRPRWRVLPLLAGAVLIAACTTPSASGPAATTGGPVATPAPGQSTGTGGEDISGQEVTVIGTWGGDEETAFREMVKPWEDETGATVKYTGTRDLNIILSNGIQSGVLPDLAGLPGPGQMAEYAQAGALQDLTGILDMATYTEETAPALVDLGTVDGKVVGVFIKSAVKGLIWYNPKVNDFSSAVPATWDDLQAAITANASKADKAWCVGVESGAASGWPGTDWIEDIVLRQAGADTYNSWWQGQTKWTDPAIKSAFETFGQVVANAYGGSTGVNATNFEVAGDPLFADPPGCLFHHQASFITGLGKFKTGTAGTDYNFFPFPDIDPANAGAVEGAGDLFGMFHDTPATRSLMAYLVTADAQDIWVKHGGALSANKNATSYPDDISKRSAELITSAKTFVFDASDLMPQEMNAGFWKAIVDYIADPSKLDSILADLDNTQASAYAP
ncbi:MAG TPA: extracellular solute-binding protein [Candidatus Limnocylindrales bacterium]|nr:extracellular solute-binding protein [Candidatus Limnocylindrales bacterium]